MDKIQILFPEPVMRRLRRVASREDRPVSEIVRRAVDRHLQSLPDGPSDRRAEIPVFDGGSVRVSAEKLRDVVYEGR